MPLLYSHLFPVAIELVALYFYLNARGYLGHVEFADEKRRRLVEMVSVVMMVIAAVFILVAMMRL
ncbi:MAG: hypothetical protein ACE5EI_04290 [Thermodesulfobacteriota bacterium]